MRLTPTNAATLAAVAVLLAFLACIAIALFGCGHAATAFDDANNPADDLDLANCRTVGRRTMLASDAGRERASDDAFAAYLACKRDAGFR